MRKNRTSAIVVLAALALGGCAFAGGGSLRVEPEMEARTLSAANGVRRGAGLPDLRPRRDLTEVARRHALDMARRGYLAHITPEGTGPGDRARKAGVVYSAFAENLARVKHSDAPEELAVSGWVESPTHRRNLLDERGTGYIYTGVGVARAPDGTVHIAQVFLK
ncbi:MAG: CAP domain-containing protein [Planctomycetes bacterium]|jgi:uncharacterized protein YkwD|nr:CAP domain-containing protein [Planctomycetota bacterium]